VVGADRDPLHPFGLEIVPMNELQHDAHPRVRQRSARMRLDGHAGRRERPWISKLAVDHLAAVAASRSAKGAAIRLQADRRSREPERGELRCNNAAFRGAAGVKGLGHGAEVFAQAAGLAATDTQGATRALAVQAQYARRAGGGADRAAGRGAVETVLVVAW